MNEDLFSREFRTVQDRPETDNLFLWTVGIILLIGVALACWLGSYYLFGHPEKPDSYHILKDVLHKLEPPKRFVLTAAPPGVFLNPQKAYETRSFCATTSTITRTPRTSSPTSPGATAF